MNLIATRGSLETSAVDAKHEWSYIWIRKKKNKFTQYIICFPYNISGAFTNSNAIDVIIIVAQMGSCGLHL